MNTCTRRLALAAIVTALAGCAASVVKPTDSGGRIQPSMAASKQIVLSMTGPAGSDSGEDWEAFKAEWQTSMKAAAAESGASFSLAAPGEGAPTTAALWLKMKVKEYRYVSQAKRYAVGIFTGNASLDIEVEFVETPAGTALGTRKYAASSSALQGVFAAMTPKQVEAVAKDIIKDIGSR